MLVWSRRAVGESLYIQKSCQESEQPAGTDFSPDCRPYIVFNRLRVIWKSDLTDKMKRSFFQAAVVSILLYGCTTWTLTKRMEKNLECNYTGMLRGILNKSWRPHPTKQQLYGHLPPITKTIKVRRTRHAGHCWKSRDNLISDVLLWTPSHSRSKAGRPARTYVEQLCEDMGCSYEDLPEAMNNRGSGERGSGISMLMARQDGHTSSLLQCLFFIGHSLHSCNACSPSVTVYTHALLDFW